MKRISDEQLNKMIGWRLSGAKPLELVDNDTVMNLLDDLRDARERANKEASVRNVFVGGALQATDALVRAEKQVEELTAELTKLKSERDEDLIAVAAEMVKDIDTDAVKQAIEADRRATKAEAEVERLNRVTVAYWARFGAVPEDGEQILYKAQTEIEKLRQALVHVLADFKEIRDDYGSGMYVTDVANSAIAIVEAALKKEPEPTTPSPDRPEKTTCPRCRTLYRPGERHACAPGAIGCDCSPSTCSAVGPRICRCICHPWNK